MMVNGGQKEHVKEKIDKGAIVMREGEKKKIGLKRIG